ncbi:hypothetical protein B9Z55_025703 [Caenorhabditis nigoni]|uniref:Uncharacterized protein n=1 Tax=Caenorhabditis nigoni TaxID=1611254 RepID=A0A2G5SZI3_9PELO|nr:hypothetical protein B9Z55_025703 [Caenorhabditis nigoni]
MRTILRKYHQPSCSYCHTRLTVLEQFTYIGMISNPKLWITTDQLIAHQFYKDINWKTITTAKPTVPLENYESMREEILDEDVPPGFDLARLIKLNDGLPMSPSMELDLKDLFAAAVPVIVPNVYQILIVREEEFDTIIGRIPYNISSWKFKLME